MWDKHSMLVVMCCCLDLCGVSAVLRHYALVLIIIINWLKIVI